MLDNLKWYLINIGVKKYAPVAMMAALTAFGTLMAAHVNALEQWGVNYIPDWTPAWLMTHSVTGPVLLVELDTTSSAVIALAIGAVALMSRGVEHHVIGTTVNPPIEGGKRVTDPPPAS